MTQVTESAVQDDNAPRETATWLKIFVVTGAILALLLMGAAVGLLIQTGDDDNVTIPGADSVDVGFSQDMTEHHRQATVMAAAARDKSTDPAIVGLAYDIETGQLEQIGRMQGYLSMWNALPLAPDGHMAWMSSGSTHGPGGTHGGGTSVATMPGMATPEELDRLRTMPPGRDFDVLFLQLMLRHHQGGIPMAQDAADRAQIAQLRNLASMMELAQTKELTVLTEMLAERGAQPLPAPF